MPASISLSKAGKLPWCRILKQSVPLFAVSTEPLGEAALRLEFSGQGIDLAIKQTADDHQQHQRRR